MIAVTVALIVVPLQFVAQTTYSVTKLEGLGGTSGQANSINDRGWVTGAANLSGDQYSHAVLWVKGEKFDLGTLGGPNSGVFWPVNNNNGVIVGISEISTKDPLGAFFSCPWFFPTDPFTGNSCQGFRWEKGVMTALPSFPGGHNSYATAANNRGQVVGWAETDFHDPTCVAPFQVLQFIAVIWGPKGEMQKLPPLPGDSTSAATAINDKGQVVGISGDCGFAVGGVSARHSVIWENGVPTNIGDLGGTTWNTPTAINNEGTVVGFSLPASNEGTTRWEAFIWSKEAGLHSLGKLRPDDRRSAAWGVNDDGQIVGVSRDSGGTDRAVIWQNGTIANLNDLVPAGSPYLIYANDINGQGQLVGQAFDPSTNETFGYLASPSADDAPASSATHRNLKLPGKIQQQGLRKFGVNLAADE
jgi:probable HAF family extracellular repeat protein